MKKSVILVGGGKSILEGIQSDLWQKIAGKEIWSLNFAFMTMPYLPARELWIDKSFFKNNIEKLEKIYHMGVQCHTKKADLYAGIPEIHTYECTREQSEMREKIYIGVMGLVGTFALALATKEQYDEIFLLGYDFGTYHLEDKHTHYYQYSDLRVDSSGVGRPEVYINPNGDIKKGIQDFAIFNTYPTKIYNCSMNSNISYFEKLTWDTFYEKLHN